MQKQSFIRREAVLSSRIEGTRASLAEFYRYETTQLSFLDPGDDLCSGYKRLVWG
jgi:hypothetical protein